MTTDLYHSGPLRDQSLPLRIPTMLWIKTHCFEQLFLCFTRFGSSFLCLNFDKFMKQLALLYLYRGIGSKTFCCCHMMTNSVMREKVATSELPGLMVLLGCTISLSLSLSVEFGFWSYINLTFKCFALSLDLCVLWYRSQTTTSNDPGLIYQFNRSNKNSKRSHSARI